ncbi:hypothetical protein DUNSADRAFT_16846 [Dunaliella salina]|uniref:Uncharacterized protein n=1 Tax=Dunaliella salina TaxID=3046 RepID=A0ABQ7G2S5_DUNSA|nr:hypothetical protein DUNSADRAFT_16846 [Dunaliella salina]|eukprot:KAF5828901.1 hypothetical protein DUNSADRAFT_16846 [Dunaliella salina]
MMQAFQVPIERLNKGIGHGVDGLVTKVTLKDRNGEEFRIKFDYINRVPSACVPEEHVKEVERLIKEDKIHILLGNTHFGFTEAKVANQAKRLTYHCCYEKDDLFKLDLPYIYGISKLAETETHEILTSMALEDSIAKLFIFYTMDFRYATGACENAVEFASSKLRRISSKFNTVKVLKYSSANISSNPTFFDSVVAEQIVQSGATAVLGCDSSQNGFVIAKALKRVKSQLDAIFLTLSPAHPKFVPSLQETAEYMLTSATWHPEMLGPEDSFFGTPKQYAIAYERALGVPPYWVTALASNTVVSLIFAIQSAFKECQFMDPANLDADTLLFDPNAIECANDTGPGTGAGIGYDLLLKSLASQSITTFFGPVEFNHFRRNIANGLAVLQVQNGKVEQLGNTWESGKARLHNTLVALEPLTEIKFAPKEINMPMNSSGIKSKPFLGFSLSNAETKKWRSFDTDSEVACSSPKPSNPQLSDIDVESLQQEDACMDSGSLHGASVNGGSVHNGGATPTKPFIQSMSLTPATSLSTVATAPKKDKSCSYVLNCQQVLELVWRSKNLQHPSVVPVSGVMWALPGMPANVPVLVTECCELGSLTSVLDNQAMELDFLKQLDITF